MSYSIKEKKHIHALRFKITLVLNWSSFICGHFTSEAIGHLCRYEDLCILIHILIILKTNKKDKH